MKRLVHPALRISQLVFLLLALPVMTIAQWTKVVMPNVGGINALATDGLYLYAGTMNDGLYRSTDNGITWAASNSGLAETDVRSLAANGSYIYAGINVTNMGSCIYRSSNRGASWQAAGSGINTNFVMSLAFSGAYVVAGTIGSGVFRSSDNGSSWNPVSGLTSGSVEALLDAGSYLLAGTTSGLFMSVDNGGTWQPTTLAGVEIQSVALVGTDIIAGAFGGGVYFSMDGGVSWQHSYQTLTSQDVRSLASAGGNLFAGTNLDGGVNLSTNGGSTWSAANTAMTQKSVFSLLASGNFLYAGTITYSSTWVSGLWRRPLSDFPATRVLIVRTLNPSSGVSITLSPPDNGGNSGASSTFTRLYSNGQNVTLTAPAGVGGSTFQKWQRDGLDFSYNTSVSLAMDANHNLTAIYAQSPPTVSTLSANPVGQTTTTLNGSVNPNGSSTTCYFEYGITTSYGSTTAQQSAGSGTSEIPVNAAISGLSPNATYHYRLVASNTGGMTQGSDLTFTTQPLIKILTVASVNPTSGVTVTVSPPDNNGQANGTTQFTRYYNSGTMVTLTAPTASGGNTFQKWLNGGSDYVTTASVTVTMGVDITLTAVYVNTPLISVTSPASGASWTVGAQAQVNWSSQNVTGNVTVKLSTDGGSTFPITLATVAASAGTASFTVPSNPSSLCRVKVESVNNSSVFGTNQGNFTISLPPTISVTVPAAGTNWTVGAQQQVNWTSQNVSGNVNILLSTDGGSNYPYTLGSALASAGAVTVTVPNNPSTTCRVKVVSATNGAVFGVNPDNFSITVSPSINVTVPLAGASWTVGTQAQVTWTSQNVTGNVTLKLSADGGNSFPISLGTASASSSTSTIVVPDNPSSICRVKVEWATNTAIYSLNPGNFSIVEPAEKIIAVTGPAPGVTWTVGTQQQVTWTSQNVTGEVNVLLSTDGGTNFPISLGTAPVTVGTTTLIVPDNPSTTCRVRVVSISNPSVRGMNPGDFTIVAQHVPTITITNPAASVSWTTGTQQQITWTSQNLTGNVNVLLSTDGGTSFPTNLGTVAVGAGTATVTVPNTPSSICRVKVESIIDGTIFGLNAGNFSIVPVVWTLTVNSENPSSNVNIAVGPPDNNRDANGATPFTRRYNAGTTVTLMALIQAGGNTFQKWLKGGDDFATIDSVNLVMDADYTLTAVYVTPPPQPPPPPTALAPSNVTVSGFTACWSSVAGATEYRLDVATDNGFGSILTSYTNLNVGNATSYAVGGLAANTAYYYRVRAVNVGGPSLNSGVIPVTTFRAYATSYVISTSQEFEARPSLAEYTSNEYQLIGLPGASGGLISDFLPGNHKEQWQVYWDNGVSSNRPEDYYVEFDGSARFTCAPGRAYWLLNRGSWTVSARSVSTAPLSTNRDVKIGLTQGQTWNIITNPFDKPIPWSAVTARNGIGDVIRAWTVMGWRDASSFDPYVGYLFFNTAGKDSLSIPYDAAVGKVAAFAEVTGWTIQIIVRSGKYVDQTTYLGRRQGAADGLDPYEQRKPRHFANIPDIYFDHPEWDTLYHEFATDLRPAADSRLEEWALTLRADAKRTPVEVGFTGLSEVPGNLAVYLVDEAGGRSVDLRKEARYRFTPARAQTRLQVLVGKEEEVKEKAAAVLPHAFALLPNYPNPFNPATTIPVVVPAKGEVSVVVYNVLGQRVKQLVRGALEPGVHYLIWEGDDETGRPASSGTYYCRMQAACGLQATRALVLIR